MHIRIFWLIIWSSQHKKQWKQSCESQTEIFRQLARRFRCGDFLLWRESPVKLQGNASKCKTELLLCKYSVCCRVNYPEHCGWLNQRLRWVSEWVWWSFWCDTLLRQVTQCNLYANIKMLHLVAAYNRLHSVTENALMYFSAKQHIWGWRQVRSAPCVALEDNNQVSSTSISEQMDLLGTWDGIIFMLL